MDIRQASFGCQIVKAALCVASNIRNNGRPEEPCDQRQIAQLALRNSELFTESEISDIIYAIIGGSPRGQ